MSEVAIIDSGGANLSSLVFALERLTARARIVRKPQELADAPRIILPGVGAAGDAMARLRRSGFDALLPRFTQPVLGICLGMQLLFARSEEDEAQGLGVLPELVTRLRSAPGCAIPHMGWNRLRMLKEDALLEGIGAADYLYFVHSFAASVSSSTLAACEHGHEFAAVVRHGNFWGTQFHPERSSSAGARVLANFLRL